MEPRIQYCTARDGVSIAYGVLGEGSPLVTMPQGPFAILAALATGGLSWRARLPQGRVVVAYDPRGEGLSERNITDFSLETCLLDLEAVVDRLGARALRLVG